MGRLSPGVVAWFHTGMTVLFAIISFWCMFTGEVGWALTALVMAAASGLLALVFDSMDNKRVVNRYLDREPNEDFEAGARAALRAVLSDLSEVAEEWEVAESDSYKAGVRDGIHIGIHRVFTNYEPEYDASLWMPTSRLVREAVQAKARVILREEN